MAKTTDYIHCDSPRPFTAVAVLFQTHNRRQYVRVVNIDRADNPGARVQMRYCSETCKRQYKNARYYRAHKTK